MHLFICVFFSSFLRSIVDKLVPLPSLFFIGKNGTPIEIVTAVTKTVDELNSKIDGVLDGVKPKTSAGNSATASANLIASKESLLRIKRIRSVNFLFSMN